MNTLKNISRRSWTMQYRRRSKLMSARHLLIWCCFALVITMIWFRYTAAAQVFSFKQVKAIGKNAAIIPYQDTDSKVPEFLLNLRYDEWRNIRFRPEKSLWRKDRLPFEVQFFHPGFFSTESLKSM
jgi:glucan biosynthesis protein